MRAGDRPVIDPPHELILPPDPVPIEMPTLPDAGPSLGVARPLPSPPQPLAPADVKPLRKEAVSTPFQPKFPAVRDASPLSPTTFSPTPRGPSVPHRQPPDGEALGQPGGNAIPQPPSGVPPPTGSERLRKLMLQRARPDPLRPTKPRSEPRLTKRETGILRASHVQEPPNGKAVAPKLKAADDDGVKRRAESDVEGDRAAVDRRLVILGSARNAVRSGRLEEAMERFSQYLAAVPNDAEVREEFAGVLASAKLFARATAELERILERRPELAPRLRTEIGNMHVQAKDFDGAVRQFAQALAALPAADSASAKLQRRDIATQLARSLGFAGDVQTAAKVFAEHLHDVAPNDPDAPRMLGALLLDLDRPQAAVAHLQVQRTRYKSDLEVLAYLIRAFAAADDGAAAGKAIEEMSNAGKGAVEGLLFVGAMLAQSNETALAESAFRKAADLQPKNLDAKLGLAAVMLADYRLLDARTMLQDIVPDEERRREYLLMGGLLFVRCGEFADAKAVYLSILDVDPADVEARLGLAGVFEFTKDLERAKAEFLKVDPVGRQAWKGRIGAMRILAEQRRFAEAIEAAEWLLRDERLNVETLTAAMEALSKSGWTERAIEVGREFLARSVRLGDQAAVNIALGRSLLRCGRSTEALTAFDAALAHRSGRNPAAHFGRSKAMSRGPHCDLGGLLAAAAVSPGSKIANDLALVDLFVEDRDDLHAEQVCRIIIEDDPTNIAAWTRLCECLHRRSIQSGDVREALAACRTALEASPSNVRILLTVARCLVVIKEFHEAAAVYDQVIAIDPDFSVSYREKARALYTANDYDGGRAANAAVRTPSARMRLETGVRKLIPCSFDLRPTLISHLDAQLSGPALAKSLREIVDSTPLPITLDLEIRRLLLDFEAFRRLECAVEAEDEGKNLKGLRDRDAIQAYKRALELEPDNAEASMDLAQAFGNIRCTASELMQYSETLAIDPRHRDAAIASDRAFHEINPQLHSRFSIEREIGKSRLANIMRVRYGEFLQWPLGDEGERCMFGFSRASYHAGADPRLDGNILTVDMRKRWHPDHYVFGRIDYHHYEDRLHSRPIYDFGFEAYHDQWVFRAETLSEYVLQNSETLRQDIWRRGGRLSAAYQYDRRWSFLGEYGYWRYSDKNDMNEMKLRSSYLFCFLPSELKGVFSIDAQTFREETVNFNPNPFDVTGIIHPYFTPRGFAIYEGRLEWTQYLSRDHFLHSNNTWYSLQYGIAWDSEFVNYNLFRALFHHDVDSWLSVGIDAHATLSDVYEGAWLGGYLTLRWPLPGFQRRCDPWTCAKP